jgi:H+/Cl- antiporter ClcA
MEQNVNQLQEKEPNIFKWALKFAASAGIAGILCCVAPAVLFMFGLMGGIYAISFADLFYAEDGSVGLGSWILRGAAVLIGAYGIYLFRKKQNQCSIEPKRKRKNLILVAIITVILGITIFLTLEKWSSWYFDKHIVPAQQEEYQPMDLEKSAN